MATPHQACGGPQGLPIELILNNFFERNEPAEVRMFLWDLLVTAICSPDFGCWPTHYRSNLMLLYQDLCSLVQDLKQFQTKKTS